MVKYARRVTPLNMRNDFRTTIPSKLETFGIVFAALLLLLLGNAHDLLQRYGLISSSEVIRTRLSNSIGSGLTKLDSFTLTRSAVTFGIWGVVGLVSFSFVQAVLQVTQEMKYREEVSSDDYIHPPNFSRGAFWLRIAGGTMASLGLLLLLAGGAIVYLLFVIPASFTYARRFLLHISLGHMPDMLIGLFTIFAGTYLLYVLLKIAIWHHRADKV